MDCVWIVYGLRHDVGEYGAGLRLRAVEVGVSIGDRGGGEVCFERKVTNPCGELMGGAWKFAAYVC